MPTQQEIANHFAVVLDEVSQNFDYSSCEISNSTDYGIEDTRSYKKYQWIVDEADDLYAWSAVIFDEEKILIVLAQREQIDIFFDDPENCTFEGATFDSPVFEDVTTEAIMEWLGRVG